MSEHPVFAKAFAATISHGDEVLRAISHTSRSSPMRTANLFFNEHRAAIGHPAWG